MINSRVKSSKSILMSNLRNLGMKKKLQTQSLRIRKKFISITIPNNFKTIWKNSMKLEKLSRMKDNSKSDKKEKPENKENNKDIKIKNKDSSPENSVLRIKNSNQKFKKNKMPTRLISMIMKSSSTTHWLKWMTMTTTFLMMIKNKTQINLKKLIQTKKLMVNCPMMMHMSFQSL